MPPTDRTTRLGLIGKPLGHSLSPLIHTHWFERHGIDATYTLFEEPTDFDDTIAMLREQGIDGFNATVPYKEKLFASGVLDARDPEALAIGAVNTVVVRDGRWVGYNTDAAGFVRHLADQAGRDIGGRAVVFGAGGAARAVVAGLMNGTAGIELAEIVVLNRSFDKAVDLAESLAESFPESRVRVTADHWQARAEHTEGAELLVNTTSLGMHGQGTLAVIENETSPDAIVADIVYAPLETEFLRTARQAGLRTVDGLGMLTGQAARAFELWFGVRPRVDPALREKLLETLAAREA